MADVSQRFNHEVYNIAVSLIRKFDERVSSIPDILKLTLGEPDFNTPEHVKNRVSKQSNKISATILEWQA